MSMYKDIPVSTPAAKLFKISFKEETDVKTIVATIADCEIELRFVNARYDNTIRSLRKKLQHSQTLVKFLKNQISQEEEDKQSLKESYSQFKMQRKIRITREELEKEVGFISTLCLRIRREQKRLDIIKTKLLELIRRGQIRLKELKTNDAPVSSHKKPTNVVLEETKMKEDTNSFNPRHLKKLNETEKVQDNTSKITENSKLKTRDITVNEHKESINVVLEETKMKEDTNSLNPEHLKKLNETEKVQENTSKITENSKLKARDITVNEHKELINVVLEETKMKEDSSLVGSEHLKHRNTVKDVQENAPEITERSQFENLKENEDIQDKIEIDNSFLKRPKKESGYKRNKKSSEKLSKMKSDFSNAEFKSNFVETCRNMEYVRNVFTVFRMLTLYI